MKGTLFLIPARGASKRLQRKNILPLAGKPLVVWTIEAARQSRIPGEVCVSTDDEEIAEIARKAGATVPFLRPPELATDEASSAEVAAHALEHYRAVLGRSFATITLLQPTSPLRDAEDVRRAFQLFNERGADCVVSVCPVEHSPLWASTLPPDLSMSGFLRKNVKGRRSQDLPQYYRLNGAIYICAVQSFLTEHSLFLKRNSYAYIMSREHSVDIDTVVDFCLAEILIRACSNEKMINEK